MLTVENKRQVTDLGSLLFYFYFLLVFFFFRVCVCFLCVCFLTKNIATVPFCEIIYKHFFQDSTWYQCVIDTDSL